MLAIFGDSHSVILGGGLVYDKINGIPNAFDGVIIEWLPGALAYNLMAEDGRPGKWGNLILEKLAESKNITATMLCFGEIDIRVHICKHALENNLSLEDSTSSVAKKIISFSQILSEKFNIPIFIYAPIASMKDFGPIHKQIPQLFSERVRNLASLIFLKSLKQSITEGIYIVSILEALLDPLLQTKSEYYHDSIHLNYRGLELAIQEFRKVSKNFRLNLPDYFAKKLDEKFVKHISEITSNTKICKISSIYNKLPYGLTVMNSGGFIFHTDQESQPYIIIDIGYLASLEQIKLWNTSDYHPNRATNIMVAIGNEMDIFKPIFSNAAPWGHDQEPLSISVPKELGFNRFIKIYLCDANFFHLSKVQIYEESFSITR